MIAQSCNKYIQKILEAISSDTRGKVICGKDSSEQVKDQSDALNYGMNFLLEVLPLILIVLIISHYVTLEISYTLKRY